MWAQTLHAQALLTRPEQLVGALQPTPSCLVVMAPPTHLLVTADRLTEWKTFVFFPSEEEHRVVNQ